MYAAWFCNEAWAANDAVPRSPLLVSRLSTNGLDWVEIGFVVEAPWTFQGAKIAELCKFPNCVCARAALNIVATVNRYELVLEPGRADKNYWLDLWRYRELFQVLAWRDLNVRYKQTVVGVAWALVRPLLTMLVFTIVFGKIAKLPTDEDVPYALLVFAGMLPWAFFSTAIAEASNSLVTNANLISKVYFPRIIVPSATVIVALVDFLISFAMFLALMLWYQFVPGWQLLLLPIFIALSLMASLGPSLWITSVNVRYRDFRYIIPFIVQFGLYVSPVGFSSSVIPNEWRLLYSLNPIVGVIDGFRWCLLAGKSEIYWPGLAVSLAVIAFFSWYGVRQFRRMERSFADLI